jgi:beta-N-acetylhexosaminidase
MLGFRGSALHPDNPIARELRALPPGFVVLFDRDIAQGGLVYNIESPDQVRSLTAALRSLSEEPICVALDQEGGLVARLKPERGFPPLESAKSLGAKNDLSLTRACADQTAKCLANLGIGLNLAPVVDLDLNPLNPIIGAKERSYSGNPETVVAHADQFIQAHHDHGVLCAIKHFPGQGSARKDTHIEFVDATADWKEIELEPFRRLIAIDRCDAVMTAHVFHAQLDPEWPATLSNKIVTGILRRQLNFDGVVISDDLQMKAIGDSYGLETAVAKAIEAGVDVLAFANNTSDADPEIMARVVATVRLLLRKGVISPERIGESVRRIRALKQRSVVLHSRRSGGQQYNPPLTVVSAHEPVPELHPELARHKEALIVVETDVQLLLDGVDDEQLNWGPRSGVWSIGECIDHLAVVASLVIPKMEAAIIRGRSDGVLGAGPYKYSWPSRMFVESLQPNSSIRVKTFRVYTPSTNQTKAELLHRFLEFQERYRQALVSANGLDLVRIRVASPANRLLRFSLGIWFEGMVAHEKRHIAQAWRVRREVGFPTRERSS